MCGGIYCRFWHASWTTWFKEKFIVSDVATPCSPWPHLFFCFLVGARCLSAGRTWDSRVDQQGFEPPPAVCQRWQDQRHTNWAIGSPCSPWPHRLEPCTRWFQVLVAWWKVQKAFKFTIQTTPCAHEVQSPQSVRLPRKMLCLQCARCNWVMLRTLAAGWDGIVECSQWSVNCENCAINMHYGLVRPFFNCAIGSPSCSAMGASSGGSSAILGSYPELLSSPL